MLSESDFMRIAIVTDYYSYGMGYTENCLPKALSKLGHDVNVVASTLNIYGNLTNYRKTYEKFLGPAEQPSGTNQIDGYTVHRLPCRIAGRYVLMKGLVGKLSLFLLK